MRGEHRDSEATRDATMTDWRAKEHRRELFQDFYEFQLRHRGHSGNTYHALPYLRDALKWDEESALWYAFINATTQDVTTSLILHRQAPYPEDAGKLIEFYRTHYDRLAFDTDRRYVKKYQEDAIDGYLGMVGDSQHEFWREATREGFKYIWVYATHIPTFGRLSAYTYTEYLRILGYDFDCDSLFLEDRGGSKSHRNGVCIAAGLDEYDWGGNKAFDGHYSHALIARLSDFADELLAEARDRAQGKPWERDVSYFTLESTLCTYKSFWRPSRGYPNLYNDVLWGNLTRAEKAWPDKDLSVLWKMRHELLPEYFRLEDTPTDPGPTRLKRNYFKTHGEVIMMGHDYPKYWSSFDAAVEAGDYGERT